jgi:predicted DNA-binding ribbon-helix-helix protein
MTYHQPNAPQPPINYLDPALQEPEFRAVGLEHGRKGIRLERLFWQLLSDLAERRGMKRSQLLRLVLPQDQPDANADINATSALRCFVAGSQAQEIEVLRHRLEPGEVTRLLLAAPLPAFVIDRDKKLHEVNGEFVRLVRAAAGGTERDPTRDVVQLTLDTPVETLFSQLPRSTDSTACGYILQVHSYQKRGRTKIVRVPNPLQDRLVGFIVS